MVWRSPIRPRTVESRRGRLQADEGRKGDKFPVEIGLGIDRELSMRVTTKIVVPIIAIAMTLIPLSHDACGRGSCHLRNDSFSMPCHAMNNRESGQALEAALDHSCCRLLPVLPVRASGQTVQRFEQKAISLTSKSLSAPTISEHPLDSFCAYRPPGAQRQSYSCVLLI